MADKSNDTWGPAQDPAEAAQQVADVARRTQAIFASFLERQKAGDVPPGFDPGALTRAFWEWNATLMRDPQALLRANAEYWKRMSDLNQASGQRMHGEAHAPVGRGRQVGQRHQDLPGR